MVLFIHPLLTTFQGLKKPTIKYVEVAQELRGILAFRKVSARHEKLKNLSDLQTWFSFSFSFSFSFPFRLPFNAMRKTASGVCGKKELEKNELNAQTWACQRNRFVLERIIIICVEVGPASWDLGLLLFMRRRHHMWQLHFHSRHTCCISASLYLYLSL